MRVGDLLQGLNHRHPHATPRLLLPLLRRAFPLAGNRMPNRSVQQQLQLARRSHALEPFTLHDVNDRVATRTRLVEHAASGSSRSWSSHRTCARSSTPPTSSRASTSNSGRSSRIGVTSRPTTPWSNCCGWPSATSRTSAPAPAKPNAANPPTSAPPPPGSSKEPSPPAGDKPSLPIGDLRVARRHAWTRTHHHGARSANDRGGGVVR